MSGYAREEFSDGPNARGRSAVHPQAVRDAHRRRAAAIAHRARPRDAAGVAEWSAATSLLAALAGALLALSFPEVRSSRVRVDCAGAALSRPERMDRPARARCRARARARGFLLGLVTSVVYFSGTLYWTGDVLVTFGGLPAPLGAGQRAPAVALPRALLVARHRGARRAAGARRRGGPVARAGGLGRPASTCAARCSPGFPWVPLGDSQIEMLADRAGGQRRRASTACR